MDRQRQIDISSISDILKAKQPKFATRTALILLDLQNDFLSTNAKLPVKSSSRLVKNIEALVPAFRGFGEIFWIRTCYSHDVQVNDPSGQGDRVIVPNQRAADRYGSSGSTEAYGESSRAAPLSSDTESNAASSTLTDVKVFGSSKSSKTAAETAAGTGRDPELFLQQGSGQSACRSGSEGSEIFPPIMDLIRLQREVLLTKNNYSAFQNTSLLNMLRAKLVTHVYICGCLTNLSVFATTLDAARHGLQIDIVKDCLGFCAQERHDEALRQLSSLMGIGQTTSLSLIGDLIRGTNYRAEEDERAGPVSSIADTLRSTGLQDETIHQPRTIRSKRQCDGRGPKRDTK